MPKNTAVKTPAFRDSPEEKYFVRDFRFAPKQII